MKVLLIGDERNIRRMFSWGFAAESFAVRLASSRASVEAALNAEPFHIVCMDLKVRADDAAATLSLLHSRVPALPVVALLGAEDGEALALVHGHPGAVPLRAPFSMERLHHTLREYALSHPAGSVRRAPVVPATALAETRMPGLTPSVEGDDAARQMLALAVRAANSMAAILILGETGTGKSQLAQTIHQSSPLREKPFVTVNCPCLSRELLESDLFGHVRGSFTGAVQDTWGKVAAAEGGTLFLDEIGDLPMTLQPKLLRLLQEKQYERIGETSPRNAHVRIIAATNRDLKREVAAGRFREDLYYRLNVIAIEVPPLRHRPTQVLSAAGSFLQAICQQLGKPTPRISAEVRRRLEQHPWPGNLRELRNVMERAAILANGASLEPDDFPTLRPQRETAAPQVGAAISLHALETAHIQMVVASTSSLEEAARILEIDKSTLYRKRKQMEAGAIPPFSPVEAAAAGALN